MSTIVDSVNADVNDIQSTCSPDLYYLVHCDSATVQEYKSFVGIAFSLQDLMPLLFDYHRSIVRYHANMTGDNLAYDTRVYKINHEDYLFLESECAGKFANEATGLVNANLVGEDNHVYDTFNEEFHTRYFDILERSKLFI